MKLKKYFFQSNKGFTIQDLVVALMVIMLFVGTITGAYLSIYKVQADTKIDAVATVYMVQIMERVDKVGYEEFTSQTLGEEFVNQVRNDFTIPSSFGIVIESTPANEEDIVRTVKVSLNYTFSDKERSITMERLKVKEI